MRFKDGLLAMIFHDNHGNKTLVYLPIIKKNGKSYKT